MVQSQKFTWAIPITIVALAATFFIPTMYQQFIGAINPQAAGGKIATVSVSKTTVKVSEKFTVYGSLPGTDLRIVGVTIANKMNGYSKMYPVALTKTKSFSFEASIPQKGGAYVIYLWRTTSPTPQRKDQIQTDPMPLYINVTDTRTSADIYIDENTTVKPNQTFTIKGKVYNYRPMPRVTVPRITQPPATDQNVELGDGPTLTGTGQLFEIRVVSTPLAYLDIDQINIAADGSFVFTTSIPKVGSYTVDIGLNGAVLPHAFSDGLAATTVLVQQ